MPAVVPAAPTGSTTAVTAARLLTTPRTVAPGAGQLELVGRYAFAGAALVVAGSLMPLFSVNGLFGSNGAGESTSTWEIPAGFMFSDSPDPSAFKLGLLLLAAALVLVPYLTGRPLTPMVLLLAAAPAGNVALGIYVRKLRADVYPNFGLGMVAIMAGAILIAAEALIPCWAAVKAQAE